MTVKQKENRLHAGGRPAGAGAVDAVVDVGLAGVLYSFPSRYTLSSREVPSRITAVNFRDGSAGAVGGTEHPVMNSPNGVDGRAGPLQDEFTVKRSR
jgi:hypothetical protein